MIYDSGCQRLVVKIFNRLETVCSIKIYMSYYLIISFQQQHTHHLQQNSDFWFTGIGD